MGLVLAIVILVLFLTGAIILVLIIGGWVLVVVLVAVFLFAIAARILGLVLAPLFLLGVSAGLGRTMLPGMFPPKHPQPGDPDYDAWANRTGKYADPVPKTENERPPVRRLPLP